MKSYPFVSRFENLVVGVVVSLPSKKVLVARMREEAKSQLAGLYHFVGGPVIKGLDSEGSLQQHLCHKLYLGNCQFYPLVRTQREGRLVNGDENPTGFRQRYVTTDWYLVVVGNLPTERIHVAEHCELVPGSAHWSDFTDLLDEQKKRHLRGVSLNRTPAKDILLALNTLN